MNQLVKLEKVLGFYQQQLEMIKTKFRAQANIVSEAKARSRQLELELVSTQESGLSSQPTAGNLQLTTHLMEKIGNSIRQNQIKLDEQTTVLESCRTELRAQMSKIEALEKVVANKTKTLEHEQRLTEQHLADERYLNTHFDGAKN